MRVSVTVDLDDHVEYATLMGESAKGRSFYDDALPRLLDLLDACDLTATFFAIGRDAEHRDRRRLLREVATRGHEVANHSHTHPFAFSRLSRRRKVAEIERAEHAIADAVGERPVGFRTPSFDVDEETLAILADRGYLYDSSLFPSPLLWAFMLYGRLFVRLPGFRLGHPLAAFGPTTPYHPDPDRFCHERRDGAGLLEIPISVTSWLRIPFYSTLLRRLGTRVFSSILRAHGARDVTALFHLIDLAELEASPLGEALARAPLLSLPLVRRERFLKRCLTELAAVGESVTLREVARRALEAA